MLCQLTIPARVPSGRATATWAKHSPSQPSSSQRRRRSCGLRKMDDRDGPLEDGSMSNRRVGRDRLASPGAPAASAACGSASTRRSRLLEGSSPTDALYMTVTTLAAVGYGEVRPLDPSGKLFTISLIVLGVVALAARIDAAAGALVSGVLHAAIRRRGMRRRLDSHTA